MSDSELAEEMTVRFCIRATAETEQRPIYVALETALPHALEIGKMAERKRCLQELKDAQAAT